MANESNFDIFNLSVKDVDLFKQEASKESVLYKPTADKGKDGIYRALIRFIPNPKNPQKSLVRKFVYWLEDSAGSGSYFDSPSTVGEKCPVQDLFFKLRNSESAIDKKMAEKLKRREVYYALIQIIKDPQDPAMDGKYKIFKFGYKIKQKIDEELNPQFDSPTQVFDLFEGKNFELTITKQGGFNNYDSSKFQGNKSSITIGGKKVENSEEGRKMILDSFTDAPELGAFEFKSWTDEDRSKIETILNQYRSPGESISTLTSKGKDEFNIDDLATKHNSKNELKGEESSVTGGDEDLNSFLDGLDI